MSVQEQVLQFWRESREKYISLFSALGKNILFIAPVPPPYGGVAVHASVLSKELEQAGFSVGRVYMYHRRIFDVLRGLLIYFRDLLRFDIVYDNSPFWRYPLMGLFTVVLAKLFRKKYVVHVHSGDFHVFSGVLGALQRAIFSLSDAIVVGRKEHAELLRPYSSKILVAYSLFNIEFPDESVLPKRVREFIHSHSPIILSVGAMNPTYSFHVVVEAFAKLLEDLPNAGLVLVYGTFSYDQNYYNHVLEIIRRYGIEQNILLLADFPHTNALYPLVDVFIRATTHDLDYPLSIMEAAAAGCKVLASDVVERPDFVIEVRLDVCDMSMVIHSLLHRTL